jgi:hypothetical protein
MRVHTYAVLCHFFCLAQCQTIDHLACYDGDTIDNGRGGTTLEHIIHVSYWLYRTRQTFMQVSHHHHISCLYSVRHRYTDLFAHPTLAIHVCTHIPSTEIDSHQFVIFLIVRMMLYYFLDIDVYVIILIIDEYGS